MSTPNQFVIVGERSNGNSSVGDMWLETATFAPESTLAEVWEWAVKSRITGKTILCRDDSHGYRDAEQSTR